MEEKINYHKQMLKQLEAIGNSKPTILLHACCGPCGAYPIVLLSMYFKVTVYYNSENVYPIDEYNKRFYALESLINQLNEEGNDVKLVKKVTYMYEEYEKHLDLVNDHREGGSRCKFCYKKRMEEGFHYAREHNFDYYTTVMTSSRQKSSQVMNEIGNILKVRYKGVNYLNSDFKKDDGIIKGNEIVSRCNIYRQNYCGCRYSLQDRKNIN